MPGVRHGARAHKPPIVSSLSAGTAGVLVLRSHGVHVESVMCKSLSGNHTSPISTGRFSHRASGALLQCLIKPPRRETCHPVELVAL
jgi:hypothetical protein